MNVLGIRYSISEAIIGRWGKNPAVRLGAKILKAAGVGDGQGVEILSHENEAMIRRLTPPIAVENMFRGKPPQAWREINRDAFDWRSNIGRQHIEE